MTAALENPPKDTETRQELIGTFRRIVFPKMRSESGRQFVIITVDVDDGHETVQKSCKGECDPDELIPGIKYRFFGRWGKAQQRGLRSYDAAFEFSQIKRQEPHNRGGMCQYLQRYATGIGYTWAGKLWDAFGSEAARILRTTPHKVAEVYPKIPRSTLETASAALRQHGATEDVRIELASIFDGRQFSKALPDELIKKFGIHAPRIVRHDPFKLMIMRFKSCGFARCDKLYMDLGLPPDRLKRQFACIWRALQEDSTGDTWFRLNVAEKAIRENISGCSVENLNWRKAVKLGQRAGWLEVCSVPSDEIPGVERQKTYWLTERNKAESETRLADAIAALIKAKPKHHWPDASRIADATPHQRGVLAEIFGDNNIAILGGSPGTGKTTVTAIALRELAKIVGPYSICLCAPTNAAAVRAGKALKNNGLPDIRFGTAHSLLGSIRDKKTGKWSYLYTGRNPLPYSVVVIDEGSMQSAEDAADLYEAIRPGSLVLKCGDINQLMPVGHGAPLRDMIDSGIPSATLTEVLRNGGDGLAACRAIRDGLPLPAPSRTIDTANGQNWLHIPTSSGQHSLMKLKHLAATIRGVEMPLPGSAGVLKVDPIRDMQVIVGLNEKGDCNRAAVNKLLQSVLNPNGERIDGIEFWSGDKIICSDTASLPIVECEIDQFEEPDEDDPVPHFKVVKGEIGIIEGITKLGVFVRLLDGEYLLFISRLVARNSFEMAYAITFHKSQGQQFPITVCMIDRAADRIACRELWYVGTSRFEVLSITIGELSVLHRQCRRVALRDRKTFLVEKLKERMSDESNADVDPERDR